MFAPDDEALQFPGHDHHHFDEISEEEDDAEMMIRDHPFHAYGEGQDDDDDDEDKKRKLKKLVTAILHYHISPEKLSFSELQDKQTIPSTLNQTRDSDEPFRIRAAPKFEILPPKFQVSLNFYAQTRKAPSILAKNGIIHLISAPLLPPITPLGQLFLFPNVFSTLTSSIQQVELDNEIAPWLHNHDDDSIASLAGSDSDEPSSIAMSILHELVQEAKAMLPSKDTYKAFPFTIFAPTNGAFAKIP